MKSTKISFNKIRIRSFLGSMLTVKLKFKNNMKKKFLMPALSKFMTKFSKKNSTTRKTFLSYCIHKIKGKETIIAKEDSFL